MDNNKTSKYDYDGSWFKKHRQTQFILDQVPSNTRVLEFGCHSGLLSQYLIEKGCVVTGFDLDEKAIEKARERQVCAYSADLNDAGSWQKHIKEKRFDIILFIHILEHLYSPHDMLKMAVEYLNKNGAIIIALPNICNAKNRFEIALRGKFEYKEFGVMDNTHIRFFTYGSALELIKMANLKVVSYFSPQQVNPPREFLDNLPIFCKIKNIFREGPPLILPFSNNLTDVVMMFKCELM